MQSTQPPGGGNPFSGLFKGSPANQPHRLDLNGSTFVACDDNVLAKAPNGHPNQIGLDPRGVRQGFANGLQASIAYGLHTGGTRNQFNLTRRARSSNSPTRPVRICCSKATAQVLGFEPGEGPRTGYDTFQEVGLIKRTAALLQQDLVLLGFYTNDVPDALAEKESAGGGTTIAAANPVTGQVLHMNPAPTSWLEAQLRLSRAIYTGGHALKALVRRGEGKAGSSLELDLLENRSSADLERAWEHIDRQLAELRATAAAGNFQVGIIILPPREQISGQFVDSQYQPRLRAMTEKLGFFVIDPLPARSASPVRKDRLFILYDRNHPSAAGHRIIGETVADFLNRHSNASGLTPELSGTEH